MAEDKRQPTAEVYQSITVRSYEKTTKKIITHTDSKIKNSNYPTIYKNTTNQSNYAKDKLMKFLNKRYRPND